MAAAPWLLVFTSNLNLYPTIYAGLKQLLTAPPALGSTGFTLGNTLLFFFILFVSGQLQRYVGYFFGEVGEDASAEARHRGSWLVGLRLRLVGFGLATAATGLPLSKLAIAFGGLNSGQPGAGGGIGAGLGLGPNGYQQPEQRQQREPQQAREQGGSSGAASDGGRGHSERK